MHVVLTEYVLVNMPSVFITVVRTTVVLMTLALDFDFGAHDYASLFSLAAEKK
jgi:hypothetical protein